MNRAFESEQKNSISFVNNKHTQNYNHIKYVYQPSSFRNKDAGHDKRQFEPSRIENTTHVESFHQYTHTPQPTRIQTRTTANDVSGSQPYIYYRDSNPMNNTYYQHNTIPQHHYPPNYTSLNHMSFMKQRIQNPEVRPVAHHAPQYQPPTRKMPTIIDPTTTTTTGTIPKYYYHDQEQKRLKKEEEERESRRVIQELETDRRNRQPIYSIDFLLQFQQVCLDKPDDDDEQQLVVFHPLPLETPPPAPVVMSEEYITRKVNALLNKLTLENFDSISSQIFAFAHHKDTLCLVLGLTFEKACDEPNFVTVWGRLCRYLYDSLTDDVLLLFRKYLFNRCQTEFEKGWNKKTKKKHSQLCKEEEMLSDEYYVAAKAKRQGLGLIQFIGELFKLEMLSERIMYSCMLQLCNDPRNAGDEDAESLCKLLSTIGQTLDGKAKTAKWLDVIMMRIETEMLNSPNVSSRSRFMILDLLDLRKNHWVPRNSVRISEPTTIAKIHELAEKEEAMKRSLRTAGRNWKPRSGEFSKTVKNTKRSNPIAEKPKVVLSDEQVKRKCKNILEEYLNVNDIKELAQCVKELDNQKYLTIFIGEMLTVVEKKPQDVEKVSEAIEYLRNKNLIQKELYVKSFKTFMLVYDDLTIDVPQAPKCVAQLLLASSVTPEEVCEHNFVSLQNAYRTLVKSYI